MQAFALGPAMLWLSCGALGAIAAAIVLVLIDARFAPLLDVSRSNS